MHMHAAHIEFNCKWKRVHFIKCFEEKECLSLKSLLERGTRNRLLRGSRFSKFSLYFSVMVSHVKKNGKTERGKRVLFNISFDFSVEVSRAKKPLRPQKRERPEAYLIIKKRPLPEKFIVAKTNDLWAMTEGIANNRRLWAQKSCWRHKKGLLLSFFKTACPTAKKRACSKKK